MRHCPDPLCPHHRAQGVPATYRDDIVACADCGAALSEGAGPEEAPRVEARGPRPWRALAVTALVPMAVWALAQVPLPGLVDSLDDRGLAPLQGGGQGLAALGFAPIITGFILVELFALVVPALRRRRHQPATRRGLTLASYATAAVLIFCQGLAMVMYLNSREIIGNGVGPGATVLASLSLGVVLLLALAWGAGRYGLVGGLSLGVATSMALGLVSQTQALARAVQNGELPPVGAGVTLAGASVLVAATAYALRVPGGGDMDRVGRGRGGAAPVYRTSEGPAPQPVPWILGPAAGVFPLSLVAAGIAFVGAFGRQATGGGSVGVLAVIALGAAVAAVMGRVFNPRAKVLAVVTRCLGAAVDPATVAAAVDAHRAAALRTGVVFAAVACAVPALVHLAVPAAPPLDAISIAVVTAVVLDALASWRAARAHGALVTVRAEHRVYAVDAALAALAAHGIPGHARSAGHRALLQFFGPYVPVEIQVPVAHGDEARGILAGVLADGA